MAKRNTAWKADLEAVQQINAQQKLVKALTSDLPINAKVIVDMVDDPNPTRRGYKSPAVRSIRDDILAGMLARAQIDQAQYAAGRHYQACAETCEIGAIQAMDPGKEAVDGGRMREPITDRQIKAFKDMAAAHKSLGGARTRMMVFILTRHIGIRQYAESMNRHTNRGWKQTGVEFRGGLETLARLWGFTTQEG